MGRPVESFMLAMVGMAPANTESASTTHTVNRETTENTSEGVGREPIQLFSSLQRFSLECFDSMFLYYFKNF